MKRILYFVVFLFFKLSPVFSQIVNDTTKEIYGTNTTKIFDQNTLYLEKRIFFKKDTLFTPEFKNLPVSLPLNYQRPKLYTLQEKLQKRREDSLLAIKLDSAKKAKSNDPSGEITYLKKDTIVKQALVKKTKESDPEKIYNMRFYKNDYLSFKPDTSIDEIHQYNNVYIKRNIYQNLGILGTPSKPVFLELPKELGYHSGFNSMNLYFEEPAFQKYYNSRSAFTDFYYGNSINGEDRVKVEINRNVTRNWNIGFTYTRISVDKQIGLSSINLRSLAQNQDFKVYSSFKSANERYHFMGNISYFVSRVNEQGGLKDKIASEIAGITDLPRDQVPQQVNSWPVYLNPTSSLPTPYQTFGAIFSRDRRLGYHFYHQYDIFKGGKLSIFHELDRRNQKFTYKDPFLSNLYVVPIINNDTAKVKDSLFYKSISRKRMTNADSINFNLEFAYFTNKAGLKGNIGPFVWIGYLKNRNINVSKGLSIVNVSGFFENPASSVTTFLFNDPRSELRINENYAGGELIFRMKDSLLFHAKAEQMLFLTSSSKQQGNGNSSNDYNDIIRYTGDHHYEVSLGWKNFKGGLIQMQNAPFLIQLNSFNHNNYSWANAAKPVRTFRGFINSKFDIKNNVIEINPSYTLMYNYAFFDGRTDSLHARQQTNTAIVVPSLELVYRTSLSLFHFDLLGRYTLGGDSSSVLRYPNLYFNPRVYISWAPKKKSGRQEFRIGFDGFYRSSYYGDAYMPSISQFYIQNNFLLQQNFLLDFFITAKLRNARLFAKVNQINQLFGWTRGYYITPYYPGNQVNFAFGVSWFFFD